MQLPESSACSHVALNHVGNDRWRTDGSLPVSVDVPGLTSSLPGCHCMCMWQAVALPSCEVVNAETNASILCQRILGPNL